MKLRILILFLTMLCGVAFAAGEIAFPASPGLILYFTRFEIPSGNVFLSDGLSSEVWGTGGRDANDYDVPMAEIKTGAGSSGWYVGDFDSIPNIGAGTYNFSAFIQAGGSPADGDRGYWWGSIIWDGSAEVPRASQDDVTSLNNFDPANDTVANVTLVATTTTNDDMRGTDGANTTVPDAAGTAAGLHATTDAHLTDIKGSGWTSTDTLVNIYDLGIFAQNWLEADEFIDDSNPAQFQNVRTKKQSGGGGTELSRKNYNDIDGNPIINLRTVFAETQEP